MICSIYYHEQYQEQYYFSFYWVSIFLTASAIKKQIHNWQVRDKLSQSWGYSGEQRIEDNLTLPGESRLVQMAQGAPTRTGQVPGPAHTFNQFDQVVKGLS